MRPLHAARGRRTAVGATEKSGGCRVISLYLVPHSCPLPTSVVFHFPFLSCFSAKRHAHNNDSSEQPRDDAKRVDIPLSAHAASPDVFAVMYAAPLVCVHTLCQIFPDSIVVSNHHVLNIAMRCFATRPHNLSSLMRGIPPHIGNFHNYSKFFSILPDTVRV